MGSGTRVKAAWVLFMCFDADLDAAGGYFTPVPAVVYVRLR